jgi:hypothetical protein
MEKIISDKETAEKIKINVGAWMKDGDLSVKRDGMNATEAFIQNEIEKYEKHLKTINPVFTTIQEAKEIAQFGYIGAVDSSPKIAKGKKYNYQTFIVYLAAAKQSGREVCAGRSKGCTAACLYNSGQTKIQDSTLASRANAKGEIPLETLIQFSIIKLARIKRTILFFEHRRFFVDWLIAEIKIAQCTALAQEVNFAVRLNGTSDLNPTTFQTSKNKKNEELNILEVLPDVQFYDYTKVLSRKEVAKKYKNYNLTYSYSGENKEKAISALEDGINVLVVFGGLGKNGKLPSEWEFPNTGKTFEVIDGDETDLRFLDKTPRIVGLRYKVSSKELDENTEFVQKISGVNDGNCGCAIGGEVQYVNKPLKKSKNKSKCIQSVIAGEVMPIKRKNYWPFIGWD